MVLFLLCRWLLLFDERVPQYGQFALPRQKGAEGERGKHGWSLCFNGNL
ncbi:hypothetical protein [Chromobacterium sp. IIBBL 290-4]|nr:hypothetical protein [Chromobacterium sp. IIBBL 290-4]UTH72586.1 hypothetical protein NKT35_13665 [Chromobacterium sp. IIBBL 290-4]